MGCSDGPATAGAAIFAFRGIRYRTTESKDLSSRISPPYDVITEAMRAALCAGDERNFVRVELPQPEAVETAEDNRYTRAARTLREWLAEGVLMRNERPSLYVLEQEFGAGGRVRRRRGVFAALRLPESSQGHVLSHEATFDGPKADRLRLMEACEVMASPVLVVSEDNDGELLRRMRGVTGEPDAVASDRDGVVHRLWAVQEAGTLEAICAPVQRGPLFIADGHHRFETAMTYRDEMRRLHPDAPANAGFNHALVLVTSARDEALKILATHRLISGLGSVGREAMMARMREWFEVCEVAEAEAREVATLLNAAPRERHVYVARSAERWYRLTARDEKLGPSASVVDSLDVSVLHRYLIDPVVSGVAGARVAYVSGERAAAEAVEAGDADFAVFLRPVEIRDLVAAARAGKRMPHKSTYFYPKAPAGLVVSDASAGAV